MRYTTAYNTMLLLVFLLFICRFEYCYSNNVGCFDGERIALLRVKESLIDKSNRLTSWTGLDCCKWEGVLCSSRTGHVWKLDLHNNETYGAYSLGGEIHPSLTNLTHLQYLDLSLNNFSGTQIPEFLGSLKNLRYLNLKSFGFVGKIPTHLGNLSSLESLYLGPATKLSNFFGPYSLTTDNLDWLANLSSLKSLDMSKIFVHHSENWLGTINKLVSLSSLNLAYCNLNITNPLSLVNSTSLTSLSLQGNSLDSTVLLWLFNHTRLEYLNLGDNHLNYSSLIPLCKLHNLVSVDLSSNNFQGLIPHCLGNLTSLTSLDLGYNSLEGSIPNSISHLCRLQSLDLGSNKLSGLLTDFIGDPFECLSYSLQGLRLDYNHFTGELPDELYKYKNLNSLSLRSNSLSGPIADSLGNLSMLSSLDISYNKFSGSIPTSLGQLSNLDTLDLSHNSLQGTLSESHFSKLTNLRILTISGNSLFFNVSSDWIPPFQLQGIGISSIKIGPHFPQWLRTQVNVGYIIMSNASISDAIPNWFENFFWSCSQIDISSNNISGELPMSAEGYMDLPMQYLYLSHNNFTGEIPKWICNSKYMLLLDISSNNLFGEIPSCLGELPGLGILDLGSNNLYGRIPNSLGSLSRLYTLHLQNNKLEGGLPSSMQNLRRLITLDLSENKLEDVIPSWMGEELSSLRFLKLQANKFFGDIPLQLCYLNGVQLLNLANNNISGHIPRCFNNFTAMVVDSLNNSGFYAPYEEYIYEDIKGLKLHYTTNLRFLRSIDLSGNHIIGQIPVELMSLHALNNLNLSGNNLTGIIPQAIGNLNKLESLDLSRNAFSGPIPPSLSSLLFLSYLNLSFNKLFGRIPMGRQLQTLDDPSIYMGNEGLCGAPLLKSCPGDDKPSFVNQPVETNGNDHEFFMWFYAGMGPGFFVGFMGVLCTLLFKTHWRNAYFKYLEITFNKVSSCISFKGCRC